MSHGNDRLRRFGTKALLLGLLLGSVSALEARFQTLRLFSLTLTPWNLAIENQLFRHTPSSAQRFWPLSILCFHPCQETLEGLFPVKVNPSISGWARVNFSYIPREVFLRVKREGQIWTLSKDGKIWPRSLDLEPQQGRQDVPVVEWADDLPPIFESEKDKVVNGSTLPIHKIKCWLEGISEAGWAEDPIHLNVKKRTGGLVLELHRKFGGTEIKLILPEDTVRWTQIFQALKEIRQRLTGKEKWVQIDATYDDKIVVKRDIL